MTMAMTTSFSSHGPPPRERARSEIQPATPERGGGCCGYERARQPPPRRCATPVRATPRSALLLPLLLPCPCCTVCRSLTPKRWAAESERGGLRLWSRRTLSKRFEPERGKARVGKTRERERKKESERSKERETDRDRERERESGQQKILRLTGSAGS